MKIMPIKTAVLATLVTIAPVSKIFSQVAKDSTLFTKPLSEMADTLVTPQSPILAIAQGGFAKDAPTYGFGFQVPKIFTLKTDNGNPLLYGNIDFIGLIARKEKYGEKIRPNANIKGSLVTGALAGNEKVNLRLANVSTLDIGEMAYKEKWDHISKPPVGETMVEFSNLTGPVGTFKLGDNTIITAMGGLKTSNKDNKGFGWVVNAVTSLNKYFSAFFKSENTSSVGAQLNTGVKYKFQYK
ncbi:MAG: hypothetical protein WCF95_07220 [bacterium]